MKKLFAIAIAASILGGLYGFSIGLGGQYVIGRPGAMEDSTFAYPAIVADIMCKPLPILGFRIGLVQYNIIPEEEEGALETEYKFGLGTSATALIYIPMAGAISPYIPLGFTYEGRPMETIFYLAGGIGAEMGFGVVSGYLEGGINFVSWSPEVGDSESDNWFYVQGGVRIPIGL
ncbi:hypothetical protein ES705_27392 [subsurface metagenome]|jgi:hypothetical protein